MPVRMLPLALAVLALLSQPALAQPAGSDDRGPVAPLATPSGDVTFKAVLDLPQSGSRYQPQLREGQDAIPAQWPASLYVRFQVDGQWKACTAALVGPQVMLTAAHCVPTTGAVSFDYGTQPTYHTACTRHPRYAVDASSDFALCRLDRPFAPPVAGYKYESIANASMNSLVGAGPYVMLTGFGCTGDAVAQTSTTGGTYKVGYAMVDETSGTPAKTRGAEYYAPQQVNNLFTRYDASAPLANLCPGDSGGPAFLLVGGPGEAVMNRVVVAVNSRVFYNRTGTQYRDSMLSGTGGPDFRSWAVKWLKDEKLSACGLGGGGPCR